MPWTNYIKWAAIAILVSIFAYFSYRSKQDAVNKVKLQYIQELSKQQQIARDKEKQLNEDATTLRNKKDEEIANVNSKLSGVLRLLAARQSRPAHPTTPTPGETCTGSQLYREDAEFLAREASRADAIIAERDYYYERYESARKSLAGEKVDDRQQGTVSNTEPLP